MDQMRAENIAPPVPEFFQMMSKEWKTFDENKRKTYVDRYCNAQSIKMNEAAMYAETETYRLFLMKMKNTTSDNLVRSCSKIPGDIPVFSKEFLQYNMNKENKVLALRRSCMTMEAQNVILQEKMKKMKSYVNTIQRENMDVVKSLNEKNESLAALQTIFMQIFGNYALPGAFNHPTCDTLEDYMRKLLMIVRENDSVCRDVAQLLKEHIPYEISQILF